MAKQRKKPGRKTVMGPKQRAAILRAIGDGGSIADAAGIAKVSVRTVRRHMRQDRQFGIGVLNARKRGKMRLVRKVTGNKSWQSAAWYLERIYGKEYSRKDRQEVTGRNGGPIQNEHRGIFSFTEFLADLAVARGERKTRLPSPNGN